MPASTPLFALALVALLTGCSGGSDPVAGAGDPVVDPSASAGPSRSSTPSPTATPSGTPSGTPSAAPTSAPPPARAPEDPLAPQPPLETAPAPGLPVCSADALSLVDADMLVETAYTQSVYVLRTEGPDCQLEGFPAVTLLGADGAPLPAEVSQGGFELPDTAEVTTLSRRTSVSFRIGSGRDGSCTDVSRVVVRLPGTTADLTADTGLRVCAGAAGVGPVERRGTLD